MKILIMGPPTSNGYKSFGVDSGITGGGWVENLIKNLYYNYKEILDINTCFYGDFAEKVEKKTFLNINYYVLPVRVKGLTYCSSDMEQDIKNVISDCRPDIVHIIGTEREHNLKMFEIVGKNNCLISITGMVSFIAQHYYGGVPKEIWLKKSLGDILRKGGPIAEQKRFVKYGINEQRLIREARYIMGRTTWDYACVKQINPGCDYIYCGEILNNIYMQNKWTIEKSKQHRIFVSQGSYPLKGLHMLLEAFPIIVKQYPDAEIYVAGVDILEMKNVKDYIKRTTYAQYLKRLIKKYGIEEKIHFTGSLNANGMLEQYLKSNVFVLPSAIENSPNSLGEAMILGVPCVASCVGGVQDMICDRENGFIYPFDEPYMLAYYICQIFANPELAKAMGEKASESARKRFDAKLVAETTMKTYKMMLERRELE